MKTPLFLLVCLLSCTSPQITKSEKSGLRHGIVPINDRVEQKLTEGEILRGKKLYLEHCLSCHGEKGKGDGPLAQDQRRRPADLRKLAKEVKNFYFFMSVSEWDGAMPGWKEPFTSTEREELSAYIKTFAK